MESILDSLKQLLGIEVENGFDKELIIHINSLLSTLCQLGVGPEEGYKISGKDDVWSDFIADRKDLEDIKTYMYLKLRLIFDPPQNSFLVSSIKEQCLEYEWRIEVRT